MPASQCRAGLGFFYSLGFGLHGQRSVGRGVSRAFRVRRFPETNTRVYKTLPLALPAGKRRDLNYRS